MEVSKSVVSLGSFRSSVVARRSRVALRVSMNVRREGLGPGLSPLGSLTMMASVG